MKLVCAVGLLVACGAAAKPETPSESVETRAAAMVDAFTNNSPLLTPDGHVVFISNRDGVPLLYVGDVAHPSAAPRKLPTGNQRVGAPSLMPDGQTIVYLSDTGTNQKFHVFAIHIDGSHLVDLTPADDLRRESLTVARKSGTLFYTGHVLEDQTTHVYMQTLGGEPRELYKRASAMAAMSGPPGHELAIGDAKFSADGASLIYSSEARGRPTQIDRVDLNDFKSLAHYEEPTAKTASTVGITASPKGDRVVALLDAGDHFEVRMLDATTLAPLPLPNLPLASFSVGQFTDDGATLTLTELSATGPADIVALDVASGTVKPLRDEPRTGLGAPPHASIEKLRAFDGLTLPVNLYMPPGPVKPRPVLVLVHGGPSGSAFVVWTPTIAFFTAMGFVVVAPNIRGSVGFGIDYQMADDREHRADALHDMETINTWVRAQPWCDPKRIVIGGISYGGYMTLLALARQPTLWAAGIDGSGMSNLVTMEQMEDQAIRQYDDTEFGKLGTDDALLREWSPITHVANIVAPLFVYQGARDPVTPQHEADQIVEALEGRHVPVEYMLLPDEGHGVTRREDVIAYLSRSYRFLATQLGL